MKKALLAVFVLVGMAAMATDLVIQSLDKDGRLIFNEIPDVTEYQIENKSSLIAAWDPLLTVPPAGTGSITSTVPVSAPNMFFRVVAAIDPLSGMVSIPGGSNHVVNDPIYGDYTLTVESFYMDETEVSKAQWDAVHSWALANGYGFDNTGDGKASDHPVVIINWYDCVKWCNARSEKEGKTPCYNTAGGSTYKTGQSDPTTNFDANGYRLPTWTEWEYAARGGLSNARFPWGDTIAHSQANYYSTNSITYDVSLTRGFHPDYDEGSYYTSPVASFATNNYGLYDMAGNVWEWCDDVYNTTNHLIVSGSWSYFADAAACSAAYLSESGSDDVDIGFRAVRR